MPTPSKPNARTRSRAATRPRIDAVRPLADDPNQVEIRVGGRTVATLLRARAEELGANEGAAWTPGLAARVDAAAAVALAREAALGFLARRAWSAAGLRERLVRARHGEHAADAAVRALMEDGWLDDGAFAAARVEHHRRTGPIASEALESLLQAEGVGERHARAAAKAGGSTAAELRAEARRARKAGDSAARIAGRLARRGFDADTIRDALEHAGFRVDD